MVRRRSRFYNSDEEDGPRIWVERFDNTGGSTAGVGSGEFHQYRIQRRRERARLRQLQQETKLNEEQEKFDDVKNTRENTLKVLLEKKTEKRKRRDELKKLKKKKFQMKKKAELHNSFKPDGNFREDFLKNSQNLQSQTKNEEFSKESSKNETKGDN